jgi:uridine kinase
VHLWLKFNRSSGYDSCTIFFMMTALCSTSLNTLHHVRDVLQGHDRSLQRPLLVGIGGPGGSGKSTVTRWLNGALEGSEVLELDHFRLSREERLRTGRYGSHPEGNDLERVMHTLAAARSGQAVHQPWFHREEGRVTHFRKLAPASLYLVDGEITAHTPLRSQVDVLILVTAPLHLQFRTRLIRDRQDRGYGYRKCLNLFWKSNLLDYPRFAVGAQRDAYIQLRRTRTNCFVLRS